MPDFPTPHLSAEAQARYDSFKAKLPAKDLEYSFDSDEVVAFLIPPEFAPVFNLLPFVQSAPPKIPVHIVPGLSIMVYLKKNGGTYPIYPTTQGQPN